METTIKMSVRKELNDADVMLHMMFDGTEDEEFAVQDINDSGCVSVRFADGRIDVIKPEDFAVFCGGVIEAEYAGNGRFLVTVAETEDADDGSLCGVPQDEDEYADDEWLTEQDCD